eukprot:10482173-Alexandrium_andersonii.AAC.1
MSPTPTGREAGPRARRAAPVSGCSCSSSAWRESARSAQAPRGRRSRWEPAPSGRSASRLRD